MSNTITIKHGAEVPGNNVLAPYELGYVSNEGILVLGQKQTQENQEQVVPIKLNYLQLNTDGTITIPEKIYMEEGKITLDSKNLGNPKIFFTNSTHSDYPNSKISIGMLSSGNRCQVIHWGQNENGEEKYEIFRFPAPDSPMIKNQTFQILTTKGGTLVASEGNYGTVNPNTAGIDGTTGQLYFVIAE